MYGNFKHGSEVFTFFYTYIVEEIMFWCEIFEIESIMELPAIRTLESYVCYKKNHK